MHYFIRNLEQKNGIKQAKTKKKKRKPNRKKIQCNLRAYHSTSKVIYPRKKKLERKALALWKWKLFNFIYFHRGLAEKFGPFFLRNYQNNRFAKLKRQCNSLTYTIHIRCSHSAKVVANEMELHFREKLHIMAYIIIAAV